MCRIFPQLPPAVPELIHHLVVQSPSLSEVGLGPPQVGPGPERNTLDDLIKLLAGTRFVRDAVYCQRQAYSQSAKKQVIAS
jgi:hypothetical protein